jgi:hypothetical protein
MALNLTAAISSRGPSEPGIGDQRLAMVDGLICLFREAFNACLSFDVVDV